MHHDELLELSNSKSAIGSQSTALNSVTKLGSVDKLLEDQDSLTFSDILRGDIFKTPQKSCYRLFPARKCSPPTKSALKEHEPEQLGKRSDLEKSFLDSHLEAYMARFASKKFKWSPTAIRCPEHAEDDLLKAAKMEDMAGGDTRFSLQTSFLCSTKFEVSRQKTAEDTEACQPIDHKSLFERIGSSQLSLDGRSSPLALARKQFQARFNQPVDHGQTRPFGVAGIVKLCQTISAEALTLISSVREEKMKVESLAQPAVDLPEDQCKAESSRSDDLMASSETLSLKNFPSSSRKNSEEMHHPQDLPVPLFQLYTKFSRLDAAVFETEKMGRVSLWENHVANLQKTSDL